MEGLATHFDVILYDNAAVYGKNAQRVQKSDVGGCYPLRDGNGCAVGLERDGGPSFNG